MEWIAQQPWCDGNVGMLGDSYFAMIQYLVAAQQPPHLKCTVLIDGYSTADYACDEDKEGNPKKPAELIESARVIHESDFCPRLICGGMQPDFGWSRVGAVALVSADYLVEQAKLGSYTLRDTSDAQNDFISRSCCWPDRFIRLYGHDAE